jgi:hypothetical protein
MQHIEIFKRTLEDLLICDPPPWTIWPPDQPCKTLRHYCQFVLGVDFESVCAIVLVNDPELECCLRAIVAQGDATT